MLRVEVKGSGGQRRYEIGERIVISDDGELVGEDGDQSGRLLAIAGKSLTVAEAEALGVARQLQAATTPAKAEPKPKTKAKAEPVAEPKAPRKGRSRKKDK
jgi:hypothetical protein